MDEVRSTDSRREYSSRSAYEPPFMPRRDHRLDDPDSRRTAAGDRKNTAARQSIYPPPVIRAIEVTAAWKVRKNLIGVNSSKYSSN